AGPAPDRSPRGAVTGDEHFGRLLLRARRPLSPLAIAGTSAQPRCQARMSTTRQRRAARRNIGKAAKAARRKRTISHLPKKTRRALGKQAAKVAKRKRKKR